MKVLVGNNGNIDLDGPVEMNKKQRKAFFELMGDMFSVVQQEKSTSIRFERLGNKMFLRQWEPEEYALLLEIEDTRKISEKLGRSWMSVDIKRGEFFSNFMIWVQKKGKNIINDNVTELIEEFLKEKENDKFLRKEKKKLARQKKKEIRTLEERIENLRSPTNRRRLEIIRSMRKDLDIDAVINEEVAKVQSEIDCIKIELGEA
ncbi:MAG: hypothetical protein MUC62_08380 [Candidatus Thermoplasmatota archaeon]|jgi:hypothetical protein|nr:hypothetical protein [Candidatus Thermoplasmatota archaeon]